MVGFSVPIDIYGHVTAHLPAIEMGAPNLRLAAPGAFGFVELAQRRLVALLLGDLNRPFARIRPKRTLEGIWPGHLVRDRDARAGRIIAPSLQFKMKEHHEFAGLRAMDDFWALQNAAILNIAARLILDL